MREADPAFTATDMDEDGARKELVAELTRKLFEKALWDAAQYSLPEDIIVSPDTNEALVGVTKSGTTVQYSFASWTNSEKETARKKLLAKGFDAERVDKWIDDVNSVASVIAGNKDRLDYAANPEYTMLKNNAEYVRTLDASTLCEKRGLYQGVFNSIQHTLPNTMLQRLLCGSYDYEAAHKG